MNEFEEVELDELICMIKDRIVELKKREEFFTEKLMKFEEEIEELNYALNVLEEKAQKY